MKVIIKLATTSTSMSGGKEKIECEIAEKASLGALLKTVSIENPGFKDEGCDGQTKLPDHVDIFINGNNVKYLDGLHTRIKDKDIVYIIPAFAGG